MRKLTLAFLAVVVLVLPSLPAVAQKRDPVLMDHVNMEDLLIKGNVKGPTLLQAEGRGRPRFGALYQARKSFLTELDRTARDPALR